MEKWKRFWFEGNLYFNWVESLEDWEKVKKIYGEQNYSLEDLVDKTHVCPNSGPGRDPKYGFAIECSGDHTLRQFFEENGMEP